jgi:polar amino acid transport system substrate-binding protein
MRQRRLVVLMAAAIALGLLVAIGAQTSAGARRTSGGGDELASIKKRGVLVVATNPQYPPASFLDPSGKWKGFDIDVAQKIANALGVKVKFITPAWDVMTSGHWSGRWDIEVGSMDPIATRQKVLNFVDPPYYYLPASVAVASDATFTSLTQLNGKTIGGNTGTTYELYPQGKLELPVIPYNGKGHIVTPIFTAPFKGYPSDTNALQDLSLGSGVRLDAVIAAPTVINASIKSGLKVKLLGKPIFREPLAIGADHSANSGSLVKKVDALIAKWHRDGTLSKLSRHWFGLDYSVSK